MMLLALLVNDVAPSLKNNEGANDVMFASKTWQSQHHFPKANIVRRACYRRSPPAAGAIEWSSAGINDYIDTHAIKVFEGVWKKSCAEKKECHRGICLHRSPRVSAPPQAAFFKKHPHKTHPSKNAFL